MRNNKQFGPKGPLVPCGRIYTTYFISVPQSKNAVSTNLRYSRYIHLMSNFSSIHFHTKRLYEHMFDIVDTAFSYGRELIVCLSLQEFSKTKENTCM